MGSCLAPDQQSLASEVTTKPAGLGSASCYAQVWGEDEWEGGVASVCLRWAPAPQVWGPGASLGRAGRERETVTAGFSLQQGVLKFESRMWVWGRVAFLASILADSPNGSYLNFRKSLQPSSRHSQEGACSQQRAIHWSIPSCAPTQRSSGGSFLSEGL